MRTMCVRPIFDNFNYSKCHRETLLFLLFCFVLLCPRLGGIMRSSASVVRSSVRLSVRLMSRTSALTRKPKGLGRRNFAQGYPRSHATPTPTSRSKGQKSKSRGGGILWRPPSRTACLPRRDDSRRGIALRQQHYHDVMSCNGLAG